MEQSCENKNNRERLCCYVIEKHVQKNKYTQRIIVKRNEIALKLYDVRIKHNEQYQKTQDALFKIEIIGQQYCFEKVEHELKINETLKEDILKIDKADISIIEYNDTIKLLRDCAYNKMTIIHLSLKKNIKDSCAAYTEQQKYQIIVDKELTDVKKQLLNFDKVMHIALNETKLIMDSEIAAEYAAEIATQTETKSKNENPKKARHNY
jgi:hypothetical protein